MARARSKTKSAVPRRPASPVPRLWQLQDAKARFSQVVRDSQHAPQVITIHGEEVAVVQSIEAYRKQSAPATPHTHWLDALLNCPPGPELVFDRDPNDVVGAGTPSIFD